MKTKRIVAAILSVMLVAGVFAGCGTSGSTSQAESAGESKTEETATGEKTNLEFSIWSDEENYIRKVVDKYNESQDKVFVNLNSIPESDYDDKLKVLISGGAELDIVDIRGMAQVTTYAGTDSLLDLTDRIAASDLDVSNYGAMWNTSSNDGKFYALPTRSTCWEMFYNKDIFDKLGLPYPENLTWDEYTELSLKITEELKDQPAEDGAKIYGGYWVPWIYQFEAIQQGVYCNSDDTTALKQSLETINTLWSNGSHLSFAEVNSGDYDYMSEFENGHVAMMPNGEWCVNMLLQDAEKGNTNVNWEVAAMPIPEGAEAGTTWGQFQFAAITKTCKNPDAAFDFLTYLCGPEGSEIYSSTGMIHAYASEESAKAYKETTGKDSVSVFFNAKKMQEQPNDAKYDQTVTAFKENAELYFLGEKTIDETMKNFESQVADILK